VPGKDRALVQRVVDLLLAQDYVSGLFVATTILGEIAGTLPLSRSPEGLGRARRRDRA